MAAVPQKASIRPRKRRRRRRFVIQRINRGGNWHYDNDNDEKSFSNGGGQLPWIGLFLKVYLCFFLILFSRSEKVCASPLSLCWEFGWWMCGNVCHVHGHVGNSKSTDYQEKCTFEFGPGRFKSILWMDLFYSYIPYFMSFYGVWIEQHPAIGYPTCHPRWVWAAVGNGGGEVFPCEDWHVHIACQKTIDTSATITTSRAMALHLVSSFATLRMGLFGRSSNQSKVENAQDNDNNNIIVVVIVVMNIHCYSNIHNHWNHHQCKRSATKNHSHEWTGVSRCKRVCVFVCLVHIMLVEWS